MAAYFPIILLSTLLAIEAQPTCTINNNTDVMCIPKDNHYVLEKGLVSHRNQTTRITLRRCRITDIDFESFDGLPSLTYIDLSVNNINTLRLGVLDEAEQVTHLNLSYNMLTEFPLGLFDKNVNLDVLDLQGNLINYLELGILDPLTKLRHLDLSNNALKGKNMSAYLFDQCTNIKYIDFSNNDMNGSPDNLLHAFQTLKSLNLNRCGLSEVPQFAIMSNLKTIKHLVLSSNGISRIDNPNTFVNLDNLEILNLAFNFMESIHENVFKSIRNLKTVMLMNNGLKQLPETLFQNMKKLVNINLSHNLIEYVPVNAFRGSGAKYLNLSDNRFSFLTYNFLLELRNSGTRIVKFNFNQNPWQCSCLIQILNEVKSMEVEYNYVKFNGKDKVCVAKDEFACKRQPNDNLYFNEVYYNHH
ncbi:platelet glycoprotein V-like [Hyposmocoma kahamanoa]|uniref:platelet glycoprotein V-like n=1 Tax=Hyposmocoma kahamanoa TaxID=1477025 RepID=UPI000E6D8BAF|nr:platelet glycoprotein V-like [Hyposmocoma kahamanoa]